MSWARNGLALAPLPHEDTPLPWPDRQDRQHNRLPEAPEACYVVSWQSPRPDLPQLAAGSLRTHQPLVGQRHDSTAILTCPRVQSAQLLHDEKKVYLCFWRPSNVWDYCYNFALQAIQELLQFTLIFCHTDIESVNPVFHFYISYFKFRQILACAAQL